jgi:arylsulfatase A-like enzyme
LKKIFNISPSFVQKSLKRKAIKRGIIKSYSSENFKFLKYLKDQEYTDIAKNKIIEQSKKVKPFFILLHYWSVHIPYDPPSNYLDDLKNIKYRETPSISQILSEVNGEWRPRLEKFTHGLETKEMLARYDACIKFVDNEIGKIVSILKETSVYDNTIILITSDHGESLIEHGIYFDHHGLYDDTIRVPLIIKLPRIEHKRIDAFIQHTDIVPTILDYLKIQNDDNFDGKSILPLIEDGKKIWDYIYTEEFHVEKKKSIRTNNFKYIYSNSEEDAICKYCRKKHGDIEELYNLKTDPGESNNLINEKPQIANEFKKLLKIKLSQILERNQISNIINNLKQQDDLL